MNCPEEQDVRKFSRSFFNTKQNEISFGVAVANAQAVTEEHHNHLHLSIKLVFPRLGTLCNPDSARVRRPPPSIQKAPMFHIQAWIRRCGSASAAGSACCSNFCNSRPGENIFGKTRA